MTHRAIKNVLQSETTVKSWWHESEVPNGCDQRLSFLGSRRFVSIKKKYKKRFASQNLPLRIKESLWDQDVDNLTKIKDYKMQIKNWDSQIMNEILLVAKSEPIVIFIIFKHLTTNSPGIFHLQRGILSISPFTLVKVLEFKDNREVHRMITQTNSTLPVVTLRRIFGTTRCLGAAFSASHQPSSLELTTKKVKILQQKKKVKHY